MMEQDAPQYRNRQRIWIKPFIEVFARVESISCREHASFGFRSFGLWTFLVIYSNNMGVRRLNGEFGSRDLAYVA